MPKITYVGLIHLFGKLLLLLFFCNACTFPKDPNNSYNKAKTTFLRVGIVSQIDSTKIAREKQLLQTFADGEGMQTKFVTNNETALIKKLEKYELDIVMGGFEKKSNWHTKVGMTSPYDSTHVFFIPKGENRLLFQLERFITNNKKS